MSAREHDVHEKGVDGSWVRQPGAQGAMEGSERVERARRGGSMERFSATRWGFSGGVVAGIGSSVPPASGRVGELDRFARRCARSGGHRVEAPLVRGLF